MKTYRIASGCVLGLVGLLAAPGATAGGNPDPEEIAQHCIQRVTALAAHRVQRNEAAAAQCVATIEQLVEAGQLEEAQHVAQQCIHHIVIRSHRTVHRIQERCAHCIQVLIHLGEPKLAQAVGQACGEAVAAVNASRQEAVAAILDALPQPAASIPPAPCPSDLDDDGRVGVADLIMVVAAWGTDPGAALDLDGDGVVAAKDLVDVFLDWGACP